MNIKKRYWLVAMLLFFAACKEVYNPPVVSPVTGYLVVEGFINSGNGPSTITLTRTTKLEDTALTVYESGAQVAIEDENGAAFPMYESGSGTYVSNVLNLNPASLYHIHIQTAEGKEYQSEGAAVKQTPPVDSITWQQDSSGVQIYVSSHDASGENQFFQLKYTETWEFHSPFIKRMEYATDPVTNQIVGVYNLINADTAIYKCWKTQHPSNIVLVSTEKLTENKIFTPIRFIPQDADELSVLYYIEVKQYALSHEAYLYKQKLKKNTEQLGSIFDAQPSELGGNVHCITNPNEMVIGYVDVTQEQTAKLFISHNEIAGWPIHIPCTEVSIENEAGNYDPALIPTHVKEYRGLAIKSFYAADAICVDCTLRGTNVKPPFWP